MNSQQLCAFADWIETKPIGGRSYSDWFNSFWPEYERRCRDISANVFVMFESVKAFESRLQIGMSWDDAIHNVSLQHDLEEICNSVRLTSEDFFSESARTAFETRCKKIFVNRTI